MKGYKITLPLIINNPSLPKLRGEIEAGSLLLVDFSNPICFPLQDNISNGTSNIYNLVNTSELAVLASGAGTLQFAGGGLIKSTTGGAAGFGANVANLYDLGPGLAVGGSIWFKIPVEGASTSQYQGILQRTVGGVGNLGNQLFIESGAVSGTQPRVNLVNDSAALTTVFNTLEKGTVYCLSWAWYNNQVRVFVNGGFVRRTLLDNTRAAQCDQPLRFLHSGFFHTLYRFNIVDFKVNIEGEITDSKVDEFVLREWNVNQSKFS